MRDLRKDFDDFAKEKFKMRWVDYWFGIKMGLLVGVLVGLKHLGHFLLNQMRDIIKAAALWIARLFKPTVCPECNAYLRHSPNCPLNSKDRRLEHYKYTTGRYDGVLQSERDFRDHCVKVWSGLYFKQRDINKSIIKENNKLRKEKYPNKC